MQAYLGLEEGGLNPRTLAGLATLDEGGEDAGGGVVASQDVRDRDTDLCVS